MYIYIYTSPWKFCRNHNMCTWTQSSNDYFHSFGVDLMTQVSGFDDPDSQGFFLTNQPSLHAPYRLKKKTCLNPAAEINVLVTSRNASS